jgi:hypothetical protein
MSLAKGGLDADVSAFFQAGDPVPKVQATSTSTTSASAGNATGMGIGVYAVIILGGALAFGAWKYMAAQEGKA